MLAWGSWIDEVILCFCCPALHGISRAGGHVSVHRLELLRRLLPSEQMEQDFWGLHAFSPAPQRRVLTEHGSATNTAEVIHSVWDMSIGLDPLTSCLSP